MTARTALAYVPCRCGCGQPATLLDRYRRFRGGYCTGHTPRSKVPAWCAVEGCDRLARAKGLCQRHYTRMRKHGSTELPNRDSADRFWALVDRRQEAECWLWLGAVSGKYGRFALGRKLDGNAQAHRFAYELLVGSIPSGHELDHECETKLCVNPAHLMPVTAREHARRTLERRRGQTPKSLSKPVRGTGSFDS